MIFIPDRWIDNAFMSHIHIEGDGEAGMDNYDFTLLLIKLGLTAVIAFLVLWFFRLLRR